ncbi:hypothetical protein BD311DRAFT_666987 [Dichomitus squalens]|uniref:DUF6532 domain-containing protein n=1 Tax=Dichomitus squalens TaxID=114155 RepID=A0A4Q9MGS5_9APHY|nr:hypothetical protein BD311DRAFT_666987 [Dichomitus squalens]
MSTQRTRSGNGDQKQHGHSQQPAVEGSACTAQQPTISDMPSKHLKGGEASTKASVAAVSSHFSQHPVNVANTSLGVGLPEDSALPAPPSAGRRKSKSNTPLPGQAAGDAHGKRKRTGSDSVGADAVSQAKSKKGKKPAAEDLSPVGAANPPSKRAQAKNLSASTGGRPSKKKGAASKPASGLTRTHSEVSEQVRESEIVPPKALTPQVRKRDGAPKTNANTSQVVARNTRSAARSTQKTALPENESQVEADEDWEAGLSASDEGQHPNSPSASEFEDLSASGDDLDLEGDGQQLAATLEAERAMWNDGSELVATALKGKGKAPEPRPTCGAPIAGKTYQLQLDDFELSSESELEPDRPGRGGESASGDLQNGEGEHGGGEEGYGHALAVQKGKRRANKVCAHYAAFEPYTTALVNGLFEWLTYIYPYTEQASTTNGKRTVPWNKPYLNDCVVAVLRAAFFTGPHSIVNAAPAIFTSTLPQRQDECEVPMVMVALVGTAIHAALSDWKSGLNKSQRFSTDAYLDVYNEHIVLLKGIKSENARGYHIMMHRLFTRARCDTVMPFLHLPHTNTALAHVDFAAMDVD